MSKNRQSKPNFNKYIPDAKLDEYFLHIFPDVPEKCTGGFIGFVGNHSNEKIHIDVEIDDAFMAERNYRTICLWINSKNYLNSGIVLTSSFWAAMKENAFLEASLWHEVGHFHTARYFQTPFEGTSSNKYRMDLFNKGEIMPEEKAADLIAMYYTSKDTIVSEINWMMKTRKAMYWEPEELNMRAIYEMGRRKRYLSGIADEKELRDQLCTLCGVEDFQKL